MTKDTSQHEARKVAITNIGTSTGPTNVNVVISQQAQQGGDVPKLQPSSLEVGAQVPGAEGWYLERKLGRGGFGEVWLASNKKRGRKAAFKFAYDDRGRRALEREVVACCKLRAKLNHHPSLQAVPQERFEAAIPSLELEYARYGSVLDWIESKGGLAKLTEQQRLETVARMADVLELIHSAGISHNDIKPANFLVINEEDGLPELQLTDFGISSVGDTSLLAAMDITAAMIESAPQSRNPLNAAATHLYLDPTARPGPNPDPLRDIYALGVILLQFVAFRLDLPVGHGSLTQIEDPVLNSDIDRAVNVNRELRWSSAKDLANKLRDVSARRREFALSKTRTAQNSLKTSDLIVAPRESSNYFLSTLSHELRTPLNSVVGFSELLLDINSTESTPGIINKRERYLNNVLSAGRSLLGMINSLLEMSKLEAGRTQVNVLALNLNSTLEGLIAMIQVSADRSGIRISHNSEFDATDIEIRTDPRLFQQILFNLLSFAVRWIEPASGRVILNTSEVGNGIVLLHIDFSGGALIPKHFLPHMFRDFSILTIPTSQEANQLQESSEWTVGLGSGLAHAQRAAELLGAWLELDTNDSRSQFRLYMPKRHPREADAETGRSH